MHRLKEIRKKRGLTQAELGHLLGLQNSAISKYERFKVPLNDKLICEICYILDVSADYLLCLTDYNRESVCEKMNYVCTLNQLSKEIDEIESVCERIRKLHN